ncbi:hypothetical protein MMC31_006312 [Peltigera leucophlebia]|nr:hypothetical protein [Peltigera leucophlebia]
MKGLIKRGLRGELLEHPRPSNKLVNNPFQPDLGVFGQNDIRRPSNAGPARKGKIIIAVGRRDGYVLLKEDTIEKEKIPEGEKNAKREKAAIDALNQHYLAVTTLNRLDIFSPSLSPSTQDAPKKQLAPSIPPRPVSKRNHAATAQAQAASLNGGKAVDTEAQPIDRRVAAGPPKRGKGLSLFAPYMKPNVIAVTLAISDTKPQNSSNDTANHNTALEEDIWTDISPPPTRAPSKRNRSQHKPVSEASNNTIIDWTAPSARPPNALVPHPPLISPNKPSKKVRKGLISISPSVISEDLPIQWSSFKQPPIFSIREDHRKTEPFHPSPKDFSRPASYLTMPLTEISQNPKSAKPSLSLLPYSIKEGLGQLQSELTQQLQNVMQSEVRDMKDEMMRQFMA